MSSLWTNISADNQWHEVKWYHGTIFNACKMFGTNGATACLFLITVYYRTRKKYKYYFQNSN